MKLINILAALAVTTLASNAATIATTSFESSEDAGFTNDVNNNYTVTTGGATWSTGGTGNYAGSWTGQSLTGTQSSVIGNNPTLGHFITVDPTGSGGVGSIAFSWERFTTTTGDLTVQWTTDSLVGAPTWTDAATINIAGGAAGGWASELAIINQVGDVKVRLFLGNGSGGVSIDDVSVTAVPEPSSAALLGLGGLALILRRRK